MSAAERIKHELREVGLVTAYFLVWFLLFLGLKKLLLEQYDIETQVLGTAVVGALVVAKVVVLLDKTSFGGTFAGSSLLAHVVWRSLAYTAAVFVVTLAERAFDLYRESGHLPSIAEFTSGKELHHFLAMNIAIALAFLVYNTFAEIDRHLGEGGLRELFFRRPSPAPQAR